MTTTVRSSSSRRYLVFLLTFALYSIGWVSSLKVASASTQTPQRLLNHRFHLPVPPYYHSSFFFSRRPLSRIFSASTSSTDDSTSTSTNSSSSTRIASTSTSTTASMLSSTSTPDDRSAIIQHENKEDNQNQKKQKKILFGVRHGTSVANEYMRQPGRSWGDVTFYDDVQYTDAPLSVAGHQQVGQLAVSFGDTVESLLLCEQSPSCKQEHQEEQCSDENVSVAPNPNNATGTAAVPVELVVVSPLTRCLETWLYGVRPALSALLLSTSSSATPPTVPCIVLPLATERVYTSSDTGGRLSLQELQSVFSQPELDWSYMPTTTATTATNSEEEKSPPWWYTGNNIHPATDTAAEKSNNQSQQQPEQQLEQPTNGSLEDWRPHGEGQYYACPGEPQDVFEQRMGQLVEWLRQRPEKCIVVVTHWGVLHYLAADEPDVENCGVVRIDIE